MKLAQLAQTVREILVVFVLFVSVVLFFLLLAYVESDSIRSLRRQKTQPAVAEAKYGVLSRFFYWSVLSTESKWMGIVGSVPFSAHPYLFIKLIKRGNYAWRGCLYLAAVKVLPGQVHPTCCTVTI